MQTLNIPLLCHRPKSGLFKHVVLQSTSVCCFSKKWSFPLSVFPGLSGSSASATKSQEVPLNVPLLKRLALSIHGEDAGNPCACVCLCARVRLKWSASLECTRGCQGGERAVCSCPDWQNGRGHRWDFSLVDFSSQLAPVCLERHGNPDPNGQASYWAVGDNVVLSPSMAMRRKWCEECLRRWGQRGGKSVAVDLTQWRCKARAACRGLIWSDCALSLRHEQPAATKPCPRRLPYNFKTWAKDSKGYMEWHFSAHSNQLLHFKEKLGRWVRLWLKTKLSRRLIRTASISESEIGGGGIPWCRCDLLTGVAQPGGERSREVAMTTQVQNCRRHQLRSHLPIFLPSESCSRGVSIFIEEC